MWLLLIVLLLSTSSFAFCMSNIRLSIVNRVVVNTPKEIFLNSIPYVQTAKEPLIYFDNKKLVNNLNDYYSANIGKFCEAYDFELWFYDMETDSYCINGKCTAVTVLFRAVLIDYASYERELDFHIVRMA